MSTGPNIAAPPLQTARHRHGHRITEAIEHWLEAERDQLPLWLPVALASGIAGWFVLPDQTAWTAALVAALGIAVAGLTFAGGRRVGRRLAIAGATLALGLSLVLLRSETVAAPRLI